MKRVFSWLFHEMSASLEGAPAPFLPLAASRLEAYVQPALLVVGIVVSQVNTELEVHYPL